MAPLKDSISLDVSGLTGSAEGVWAGMLHQELKKNPEYIYHTDIKVIYWSQHAKKTQINKQKRDIFSKCIILKLVIKMA